VQLLHLIDETVAEVASRVPRGAKVGVLGTTGTIRSDLYGRVLRAAGFEVLYLEDNRQNALHAAIYNEENGIKAAAQVSEPIRAFVAEVAAELIDAGAACVVLGCTELPLALSQPSLRDVPLIDPSVALARKLIAATVS
jgi:aspartate racemase